MPGIMKIKVTIRSSKITVVWHINEMYYILLDIVAIYVRGKMNYKQAENTNRYVSYQHA